MIHRLVQIVAWLALVAVVFVTVSPIELRPHDILPVDFDRAAAFAVLAALFVTAYPKSWSLVGLAIVVGAGAIELLQELSPSRHAHGSDALIKAAGASIGVLAGWTINNLRHRVFIGRRIRF